MMFVLLVSFHWISIWDKFEFSFFAEEGEKVPEVKCLVTGIRKENLRYAPHAEVGSLDDASDAKPGFIDTVRQIQEACQGVKL